MAMMRRYRAYRCGCMPGDDTYCAEADALRMKRAIEYALFRLELHEEMKKAYKAEYHRVLREIIDHYVNQSLKGEYEEVAP